MHTQTLMMIDDNGYVGNRDNFWQQIFINAWQKQHHHMGGGQKRSSAHFQANLSLVDENDWMELGLEVICHNLKRTYSMQHN